MSMMKIPKRAAERFSKSLSRYQRVLQDAKDRDVNESDTVIIITDILSDVFGFDKYTDITSEQAIRGTYCDLAIKLEGTIRYLIEVKAIGLALKENHLRQAVGYGANHGIAWVVLTNGVDWEIYRIRFERPISHDLVASFNFMEVNPRKIEDQGKLFLLCKEGLGKEAIEEFHEHVQLVNRFIIGAIVQTDPVLQTIGRELKRLSPGVSTTKEELCDLLGDILKRDVIEGEAAQKAASRVQKCSTKMLRKRRSRKQQPGEPVQEDEAVQEVEPVQQAELPPVEDQ